MLPDIVSLDAFARKALTMEWKTPSLLEISMNAEIGGYQTDFGDDRPVTDLPTPRRPSSTDGEATDGR